MNTLRRLEGESLILQDLKNNLSNLLLKKKLKEIEIYTCMLAISFNFKDHEMTEVLTNKIINLGKDKDYVAEVKNAVAMVTMLNYYYKMRFSMPEHEIYGQVDLSMQGMMGPKITRRHFQMIGFCLTGINGASFRMPTHENFMKHEGLTPEQIHDLIKLTAITSALCKLSE